MSVAELITETQDRMINELQANQERIIDLNKRMAEAMRGFVPSQMLDTSAIPSMPGLDDLPKPTELVDGYFDFAAKVADAGRDFYKELIDAWTPEAKA